MSQWMDQPLVIVAWGATAVLVSGVMLMKAGTRMWLVLLIASIVGFGGLFVAERLIVTDREAVRAAVTGAARAVERNDLPAVLRCVHSSASDIRERVTAEFSLHHFERVFVTRFWKVVVTPGSPPEAVVEFNARAEGSFAGGVFSGPAVRFVVLKLRKEDGEWRVFAFEHHEADFALRNRP